MFMHSVSRSASESVLKKQFNIHPSYSNRYMNQSKFQNEVMLKHEHESMQF